MDPIGGINPNPRREDTPLSPASNQPTGPVFTTPQNITPPNIENVPDEASSNKPPKKPHPILKKVLLTLLAILLVAAVGVGAYLIGYSTGKSKGRAEADTARAAEVAKLQQALEESDDPATTSNTNELKLGALQEPKHIDETIEGEVGQQLRASDGIVLKVTSLERNFASPDANYRLDTSKELVKVNFAIGNVAKNKTKDIDNFSFWLQNSSGGRLVPENIVGYEGKFTSFSLKPGTQVKGSIVYAVTKNEKPLKFIREQRYRLDDQNREVTSKIVVTVAK